MTPEELKKLAIDSTKADFERIVKQLEEAAKKGAYSSDFSLLSDAVVTQLKAAGFKVTKEMRAVGPGKISYYHNVSIV